MNTAIFKALLLCIIHLCLCESIEENTFHNSTFSKNEINDIIKPKEFCLYNSEGIYE